MTDNEFDIAVLGAGGAGLSAAISAAQRGLNLVLFEKGRECGGNTSRSVGSIPGAGSRLQGAAGIEDSPELFFSDVEAQTKGQFNREGLRRYEAAHAASLETFGAYVVRADPGSSYLGALAALTLALDDEGFLGSAEP